MQLEMEQRTIYLGDLLIHAYCDKVRDPPDLLEILGEKVKERNVIIHTLNDLLSKFDNIYNIIQNTKPFPSLSETRFMLSIEETRLRNKRVASSPSNDYYPSSYYFLHIGSYSSSNLEGPQYGWVFHLLLYTINSRYMALLYSSIIHIKHNNNLGLRRLLS